MTVLAGEDDRLISADHSALAANIMSAAGKTGHAVSRWPGLGHFWDLSHSPPVSTAAHVLVPKDRQLDYGGGDFEAHSWAQEQSWREKISFLKRTLSLNG